MPQRLLLEGPDIDELLLRVKNEHGPQAKIVHAEQKLVGGVAGFFARRRYELSVQVDDEVAAAGPAATDLVEQPSSFEDLIASADGADGGLSASATGSPAERTPTPQGSEHVSVQRGRRLSTESPQFEDLLSTLVARAERTEATDAAASSGRLPAAPVTAPTSATDAPVSGAAAVLQRLGMTPEQLPSRPVADPRTALLDVLAQLPAPPLGRLWGTTVVVGPADLAHRTAQALVEHTGGTGSPALVVTSDAPSSADLAVRASALCSSDGAAVVVIETPTTRAAARRAGRLLAGVGLGTVVAAIDATRDVAATSEWLAELGGAGRHVDQLAAFDVAESPAPLSSLRLGPAVAWVDGRPATVGTWAAPCLDRMLADEQLSS
jgi:hypothetical protein